MAKKENTTSIGFEEKIWRAADKLRGNLEDEAGFCAIKTLDDIAAQDYILTPGHYVGSAKQEDDGEPFAEKMERLTKELRGLLDEGHRLEKEIKKQVSGN